MSNNPHHFAFYEKRVLYQLFVSLVIVIVVGVILFSVFLVGGIFIFDADMGLLGDPSSASCSKDIAFIKYILISQDISFFIVPSVIIFNKLKAGYHIATINANVPRLLEVVLVVILAFCIFPVTSFTGEVNSGMDLPEWLSGMEQWMREKEDHAIHLFDVIMTPDSFLGLMLNILMLAAIPAIGEELVFRGVFQNILQKLFRSGHLAVWIMAFVFSAIHFQFFGFVPRFILGLVFGYLFLWNRNLWLPIISHFANNVVPTIGAYIHGWPAINTSPDITLWGHLIRLPVPVTVGIIIMFYFWNNNRKMEVKDLNDT